MKELSEKLILTNWEAPPNGLEISNKLWNILSLSH